MFVNKRLAINGHLIKRINSNYPKLQVEKKVPYPVHVPVDRPYPVKVLVPEPYPVEKPVAVPVKVPVSLGRLMAHKWEILIGYLSL